MTTSPNLAAQPLYAILFDRDPLPRADAVAAMFHAQQAPATLTLLLEQIDLELAQPTIALRAVHDNPQPEEECREFLRLFAAALRTRLA